MSKPRRIKVAPPPVYQDLGLELPPESAAGTWHEVSWPEAESYATQMYAWVGPARRTFYALRLIHSDGRTSYYRPTGDSTTFVHPDETWVPSSLRKLWQGLCDRNPGLREKWTFDA